MMSLFPLVGKYLGVVLDTDISVIEPGEVVMVETPRRLRPEQSYGYVHALYGIFFCNGGIAFSVMPGCKPSLTHLLQAKPPGSGDVFNSAMLGSLRACIDDARYQIGLPPSRGIYEGRLFPCNNDLVRRFLPPWGLPSPVR